MTLSIHALLSVVALMNEMPHHPMMLADRAPPPEPLLTFQDVHRIDAARAKRERKAAKRKGGNK